MWTWSGVVLPIFTIASVMAAVSCRFWSWVRPAYLSFFMSSGKFDVNE